jgi:DHA1 family inner membrane transport protein
MGGRSPDGERVPAEYGQGAGSADGGEPTGGGIHGVAVVALGTGLFGLGLTVGGYGGVVPVLVRRGASAGAAGAGTSLFLLGQAVVVLPADRLSRRVGARTVAVAGLTTGVAGAAALALPTLSAALVSRTLVGLGQGAAFVAAMTYVGVRTEGGDTARAQGLLGAGFTLGFAVGLAAAPAALASVGPGVPAVASAAVVGLGAAGTASLDGRAGRPRQPVGAYLDAVRSPAAATLALANAATFGFLMVAGTWYADLLGSVALPTTAVLVGFALATVLGRVVGGVLAGRVGDPATVGWSLAGQSVLLGGTAVAIAAGRPLLVAAGVVLSGLGFGVPFGPLFALAFAELSPDPGVTLVGMLVVGNVAALAYPWSVGRLLVDTGSFAAGVATMAVSVAVVATLWGRTVGVDRPG